MVVDVPGALGSHWMTSFTGWNPHPERRGLDIHYYPETGGEYLAIDSIPAYGAWHDEDLIGFIRAQNPDLPAGATKGTIRVQLCSQGAHAFTRVYNLNPDGSTFGQGMEMDVKWEGISFSNPGILFGLANTENTRTNVGLSETTHWREEPTVVRLRGFAGNSLAEGKHGRRHCRHARSSSTSAGNEEAIIKPSTLTTAEASMSAVPAWRSLKRAIICSVRDAITVHFSFQSKGITYLFRYFWAVILVL